MKRWGVEPQVCCATCRINSFRVRVGSRLSWIAAGGNASGDQAMGQQIRQSCRIVHVARPPRNGTDVGGVGQEEFDRGLKDVRHWLPRHASRLERDDATPVRRSFAR
jgi:hypothetical protein